MNFFTILLICALALAPAPNKGYTVAEIDEMRAHVEARHESIRTEAEAREQAKMEAEAPETAPAAVETETTAKEEFLEGLEYVGTYRCTGYMWTGYRMANGVYPEIGYVATGNEFPFGTVLYIENWGYYTVGDRGVPNGCIDIYLETYENCCKIGCQYLNVWRVK